MQDPNRQYDEAARAGLRRLAKGEKQGRVVPYRIVDAFADVSDAPATGQGMR